ncbi:hypothetical protein AAFF_G00176500 [Aldrovandia affinis]|uniref:Xin actin-binding repeat-containing protein 1-like n=1 Tax=Aldrovandia affinis TaxID=143900 RepID=A0AAD7W710_9TELE|nr:hypothetical protein AAFF_G00176500 [Aldrovandia affinis]
METRSTLKRSQSLKTLSTGQNEWRGRVASGHSERAGMGMGTGRCDWKKSVSQLVDQYQSSLELRSIGSEEDTQKFTSPRDPESTGGKVDALMRRYETRERSSSTGRTGLSRSRSMDYLPPREPTGTDALRALFESKAARQQHFSSNSWLSPTMTVDNKPIAVTKGAMPGARVTDTAPTTPARKETRHQDRQRRASERDPDICNLRERRSLQRDLRENSFIQGREKSSTLVKVRSALFLSKATAADPTDSPIKPGGATIDSPITSGKKTKPSKSSPGGSPVTGEQGQAFLPVPPPKETFSSFYHQRQKSELKRLFKHIHPELRKNLDEVVDEELVEVLNSESAQTAADQCEVQSMRWIFENWSLDNIGDPHATKKLLEEETLQGADVRGTSSMFERRELDSFQVSTNTSISMRGQAKGDVHTATWLFETQPLDSLNKICPEEGELVEAVLKEPIQKGDVKGARLLFETTPLGALGRCSSIEDHNFLKLKSEIQEQTGDSQKTIKLFQAEPCCALRDSSGNIHEIKSICREEIQSSTVRTARWLFETKPLDIINKDVSGVKIIRGISLEEAQKGGVDSKRWMFETQTLDAIHESIQEDKFKGTVDFVEAADVGNKRQLFETQPLAALKGDASEEAPIKEEVVGGDVRSTLWLFETQPMETLKESYEVGCLKKVTVSEDEKGMVQNKKHTFETCTLDTINKEVEEETKMDAHDIQKGDVKVYKHLFETIPLSTISHPENVQAENDEGITAGDVKGNRAVFETTPLYAIKDWSGNFHKVTTVSREESINGSVQNYKWMFETRPLDQFEDGKEIVEVIRGITRQEDQAGDVKTAKWLFETQPLDCIQSNMNQTEQHSSVQKKETQRGDVKTCKWLFETQPMDILYEKSEKKSEEEIIPKTDVKSHTWLFETQPLDSIKDSEEQHLKLCSTFQDDVKSDVNVKTVKHLFETETLDRLAREIDTEQDVRYVSKVDVQSGDVSRVKEIFESKSLDEIGLASIRVSEAEDQSDNIQAGSVHKFTWLFENHPIDSLKDQEDDITNKCTVSDVEGGDVGSKKFIFETFSLDRIHDKDKLLEHSSVCVEEPVSMSNVNVKSSTMLFESQPLYAIRDKDGQFHEVTTVKKEEVLSGDVRGARWMFETKPLDTIKPQEEIFVIRAVTQEDVLKGDVKSARWKFETQPMDSLMARETPVMKTVEDVQKGDVRLNKQHFESQATAQKQYVRMVSVTDVQQGDVRTSTWLFENQPIDSLKGELLEQAPVQTVHREDNQKGDVKRSTWLFETQPLDTIKDVDPTADPTIQEEMPQADEQIEIVQGDVKEAKKNLNQHKEQVERTVLDIVPGDVKNVKKVFSSEGSIDQPIDSCVQKEEIIAGDIFSAKQSLGQAVKQPIVVEKEEIVSGDIKATMQSLERAKQQSMRVERDVVSPGTIYDLDVTSHETSAETNGTQKHATEMKEEIVSGDVKAAKQSLERARKLSTQVEQASMSHQLIKSFSDL